MVDDFIRKYIDARIALERARVEAERVVAPVVQAGNALHDWQDVNVTNLDLPFAEGTRRTINGDAFWPALREIGEALSNWHAAGECLNAAWQAIPVADRESLQPPPVDSPTQASQRRQPFR
ncbi:MAG TPA: hypothetical protein VFB90_03445 [Dehalococcoidia bacterium]|nr:hypothetical protein [Dehalococcoidia bacterium]